MNLHSLRPLALEVAIAFGLGGLLTLPLTLTGWWPLAWLCLALHAAQLQGQTPGRAAWLGWWFSTAWIVTCTWWLFISMHRYGGLAAPLAALAVLLLAMVLSLYWACGSAVWAWLLRRGATGVWRAALSFSGLWMLAEWARGRVLTGFPWGASGYTQVDSPLALLAPWVGVYGVGGAMALIGACLVRAFVPLGTDRRPFLGRRRAVGLGPVWPVIGLGLMGVALAGLLPRDFTHEAGSLQVALVQTNVPQEEKFDPRQVPNHVLKLYQALELAAGQAELVVAPETAIPVLPADLGGSGLAVFDDLFKHAGGAASSRGALIGLPLGDFHDGYTNSVHGFGGASRDDGTRYRYDKHHLVPFGEFVPWGFRWFVNLMSIPLGDFARGPVVAPSFAVAGQRVGPNICYEDVFGEELAQRFGSAADAPTILANVSNIAWFGDTIAIDHHLQMSRMRSLELQRPMIRATNTGATVAIDHRGAVQAQLPRLTSGTLVTRVQGREGVTPYARWVAAAGGLWPLVVLALLLVLGAALTSRR